MHIAVLCGSYAPNYSAVAICAKNLVESLKETGHIIDVIIPFDGFSELMSNVYRYKNNDNINYYSGSKFKKSLIQIKRYLGAIFRRINVRETETIGYCNSLHAIDEKNRVDLIIPFVFPIESVLGAIKFREKYNKSIKITPVIFDNFVENYNLHRLKLNRDLKRKSHIGLMRYIFNECNHTFISHSQKISTIENYPYQLNKISFIEHPLLVRSNNYYECNKHLIYAGSFLKGYVPSSGLCQVLSKILKIENFTVEFCIMGNDNKNIVKLSNIFRNSIINHGRLPFQESQKLLGCAGILISVSEISGKQISSKIFSYMSLGKPIIQFYYNDNDINCKILSKYPLFYSFKLRKNNIYDDQDINSLVDFIKKYNSSQISFDDVKNLYPEATPITLANQILSHL